MPVAKAQAGAGEQQDALLGQQPGGEAACRLSVQADQGHRTRLRAVPAEGRGPPFEKRLGPLQVLKDDSQVPRGQFISSLQGSLGQNLAGSAGADGGIVLPALNALSKVGIPQRKPANAQPGQPLGLGQAAQGDGALVHITAGG